MISTAILNHQTRPKKMSWLMDFACVWSLLANFSIRIIIIPVCMCVSNILNMCFWSCSQFKLRMIRWIQSNRERNEMNDGKHIGNPMKKKMKITTAGQLMTWPSKRKKKIIYDDDGGGCKRYFSLTLLKTSEQTKSIPLFHLTEPRIMCRCVCFKI